MSPLTLLRAAPWVAILLLLAYAGRLNDLRERHLHMYQSEHAGRLADRSSYEQAQREAAAKNQAQVDRIKSDQEKVSAEQKSRYERDLARLRSGGLRKDLAAPQGSPGCPKASAVPETASGADAEIVCVPRSLLVRAGEIELGRNALIAWIEGQLKIQR